MLPPNPLPSPRPSLVKPFLRIMKWVALFSALVAVIAILLIAYGEQEQDSNVLIATGIGVGFTMLLGSGLMVLTFLSARSGHDDEAGRSRIGEGK